MSGMSQSTSTVIVDDTDKSIKYSGAWSSIEGVMDAQGVFGIPLLNSTHQLGSIGSLSFNFTGTSVTVYGASVNGSSASGQGLNVTCLIDGNNDAPPPAFGGSVISNWEICNWPNLEDGSHTLVLSIDDPTNANPLAVDFIEYTPSSGVSVGVEMGRIYSEDSRILCDGDWTTYQSGRMTNAQNASCQITFEGTDLTWIGFPIPAESASNATYSVDGNGSVSFTIGPSGNTSLPLLFELKDLESGQHVMQVVYQGGNERSPLSLDSVLVGNNAARAHRHNSTTSTIPSPTATSTSNAVAHKRGLHPVEIGVVSALSVLAAVSIIFLTIFALWRRRRRRQHARERATMVGPDEEKPKPIETHQIPAEKPQLQLHVGDNDHQKDIEPHPQSSTSSHSALSYTSSSTYPPTVEPLHHPIPSFGAPAVERGPRESGQRALYYNEMRSPPPSSGRTGLPENPRSGLDAYRKSVEEKTHAAVRSPRVVNALNGPRPAHHPQPVGTRPSGWI